MAKLKKTARKTTAAKNPDLQAQWDAAAAVGR